MRKTSLVQVAWNQKDRVFSVYLLDQTFDMKDHDIMLLCEDNKGTMMLSPFGADIHSQHLSSILTHHADATKEKDD